MIYTDSCTSNEKLLQSLTVLQTYGLFAAQTATRRDNFERSMFDEDALAVHGLTPNSTISDTVEVIESLYDEARRTEEIFWNELDTRRQSIVGRFIVARSAADYAASITTRDGIPRKRVSGFITDIYFGRHDDYDKETLLLSVGQRTLYVKQKRIVSPFEPGTLDMKVSIDVV